MLWNIIVLSSLSLCKHILVCLVCLVSPSQVHKVNPGRGVTIAKSETVLEHTTDLKECFDNLYKSNMKLNPEKCAFSLGADKFLGFMISNRGIEANPEQIQAIIDMKPPQTQRQIQKLAGCLAALRRFISKLTERCLPFFELLKGASNKKQITWGPECQAVFESIK